MELLQDVQRLEQTIQKWNIDAILPPQAIAQLQLCRFNRGEYICHGDHKPGYLFFMTDGHCKVTRILSNGRESLTCFYRTFTVLGEVELLGCETPAAPTNVQAVAETWCLRLPLTSLESILMNDPAFLRFLCQGLCKKIIHDSQHLSFSLNYPVEQRLASYIVRTRQGDRFSDNYTHLAEYLGSSYRQLLRALQSLCRRGILRKEPSFYIICDLERLTALAGDLYSIPT